MYAAGFGAAIVTLVLRAAHGHASPGAVVEVVSLLRRAPAAGHRGQYSAGSFAIASTTADRLLWLELRGGFPARPRARPRRPA